MTALRNAAPDDLVSDADPSEGRWSQLETLVGVLVNEVRALRWVYVSAHSETGKAPPRPDPVPLPGARKGDKAAEREKGRFTDAQNEFLFRHINGLPQPSDVHLTVIKGGGGVRGD